jgi:hypothetical protein
MGMTTCNFLTYSGSTPAATPAQLPVGLKHLESAFCWCDPLIEMDGNGHEEVIHRHVTWN